MNAFLLILKCWLGTMSVSWLLFRGGVGHVGGKLISWILSPIAIAGFLIFCIAIGAAALVLSPFLILMHLSKMADNFGKVP